jgi:hypothetical protein
MKLQDPGKTDWVTITLIIIALLLIVAVYFLFEERLESLE